MCPSQYGTLKTISRGGVKFNDSFVSRELRFSLGIEEPSGRLYVSFPVSNSMVDYEEYYEINQASFDLFHRDLDAAEAFVMERRRRERDDLLIVQPGTNRGTAI
ncbi:hypothetical protein ALP45_100705 [Pseudomonas coronafaciens pv. atropurpurea]|nr:hypothetical protein ALP45_100705 [Pseudomonas coronafaciens pv. atropurpurea]